MTTIIGKDKIAGARILTLRSALSLELKGLSRRGRSVYSIVKEEFGFKGNKQRVYDQLNDYVRDNILPDAPAPRYGVWCVVSGDVGGDREVWLKIDGEEWQGTKAEAEDRATTIQRDVDIRHESTVPRAGLARFTYSAKQR